MQLKLSNSNMRREIDSEINKRDGETFSEKCRCNYRLHNYKSADIE